MYDIVVLRAPIRRIYRPHITRQWSRAARRRPALPPALRACALGIAFAWFATACLPAEVCNATDPVCNPQNWQLYTVNQIVATQAATPAPVATSFVLKYAYVGVGSAGQVGQYKVDHATGVLTPNSPASVAAVSNTRYLAAHPTGRYIYALNQTGPNISQYAVDPATGLLSSLTPATVATSGGTPLAISVHRNGKFAYAGVSATSSIDMFTIDQTTGALSPNTPATLAGCNAQTFVYHPTLDFVFVSCTNTSQVHTYSVNASGVLTLLSNSINIGVQVKGLAISPDGKWIYAAAQTSNWVHMYSVNQATGALTSLGTAATSQWPNEVVVDASGRYAYVNCWNGTAENVRMFAINSGTGLLTDLTPNAIAAGGVQPLYLAAEPTGRFLYVVNSADNTLNTYDLNASTGQLTSKGLTATGAGPRGIVFVGFYE